MATLTFLGAAGTVTGSKYLVEAGGERLLVDCGLFEGTKELRLRNWNPLAVPPASVHTLALTHAHLDHTGYIPRFVKQGFRGLILATSATVDVAHLLLPDSGHLQEEDAEYANKKGFTKHQPALPLYTEQDAVDSLKQFQAVDESKSVQVSPRFSFRYFPVGHILGARSILLTIREDGRENGGERRVLFSGDVGREQQLLIRPPAVPEIDGDYTMLCESTYGDRLHPADDYHARLAQVITATAARGGTVVIPAFAVGRTQELLYILRELLEQKKIPPLPIHVDSPMAIDCTDLYRRHHEDHNLQMDALEAKGVKPLMPPGVHFDRTVEQSKALNNSTSPMIIISASGMATGGRVLHHLARCLPDPRNTILFEGFQSPGTRGQTIQSGAQFVKIHGQRVPVRAKVESMENLSGHADYGEILRWLGRFPKAPRQVWLTHGEPAAADSLRQKITDQLHWPATVAAYLQKIAL
ncbi:MAG TPA: MBL fold metallo-hydrolase [Terriglobia bacterium]|nr:MBL fold metallo-hydrolase [Terriglobia bacterium]